MLIFSRPLHDCAQLKQSKKCNEIVKGFQHAMQQIDSDYEWEWLHRTLVAEFESVNAPRVVAAAATPKSASKRRRSAAAAVNNNDDDDDDDDDDGGEAARDEVVEPSDRYATLLAIAQRFSKMYGVPTCVARLRRNLSLLVAQGIAYALQVSFPLNDTRNCVKFRLLIWKRFCFDTAVVADAGRRRERR